jgi:hypothetical protein
MAISLSTNCLLYICNIQLKIRAATDIQIHVIAENEVMYTVSQKHLSKKLGVLGS